MYHCLTLKGLSHVGQECCDKILATLVVFKQNLTSDSKTQISNTMQDLQVTCFASYDKISSTPVKRTASTDALLLSRIINTLFHTNRYPNALKSIKNSSRL